MMPMLIARVPDGEARRKSEALFEEMGLADRGLCTDNAAMIAYVAALQLERGEISPLTAEISPSLALNA